MGRSSKRKHRDVVDDDEGRGFRPGKMVLRLLALGLSGMIVWNAFWGEHESRKKQIASIPEGATTQVEVVAPLKPTRTVTIKYDANVEDIQRELLATGHYVGLIDGVMGNRTANAIRTYQKDNGLSIDGAASARLLEHIRYTRKVAAASDQTGSLDPAADEPQQKPVKKPAKKPSAQAKPMVLDVQKRLLSLGYAPGDVNGVDSAATRAAILQFELEHGLDMNGEYTTALLSSLKLAATAKQPKIQ
jgi:peptidoglycan hydrolase-like protein with peptidoglycan-binding domain